MNQIIETAARITALESSMCEARIAGDADAIRHLDRQITAGQKMLTRHAKAAIQMGTDPAAIRSAVDSARPF